MRTCENCWCFDNCDRLKSFCKVMVFRVRRIDISLVDNLAESCRGFIDAEAMKQAAEEQRPVQPVLFVVKG